MCFVDEKIVSHVDLGLLPLNKSDASELISTETLRRVDLPTNIGKRVPNLLLPVYVVLHPADHLVSSPVFRLIKSAISAPEHFF